MLALGYLRAGGEGWLPSSAYFIGKAAHSCCWSLGEWQRFTNYSFSQLKVLHFCWLLRAPGLANRVQQCQEKFCLPSSFVLMYPKGLYRCSVLTVQSTQVGNVFSSWQAQSALCEMQQLLMNMCCNIRAWFVAKGEDAKCIPMRVEEENLGRQRVVRRSGTEQRFPTQLLQFSLPSWKTPSQQYTKMLKNHSAPWSAFALGHRYCIQQHQKVKQNQGTVHSNIYELPFVRVWLAKAGLLTNASLF